MTDWQPIALDLIKRAESFRAKAYADHEPDGILWTVGYGATGPDIGPDTVWTQEQADADLADRLVAINRTVTQAVRVRINAQQRAALVDFTYNVGSKQFLESTLLRKLNANDHDGAAEQFPRWDKDDGKVELGLVRRREVERALFKWGGA
jgi:lysozyme